MTTESVKERIISGDALTACVQARRTPNWLLIPGGAGMGCEYLIDLFDKIPLEGSVWSFDLLDPKDSGRSDADVVEGWKRSLLDVAAQLAPVIVAGHSFGGMLALSTKGIEKYLSGLILLDSSPDRGWEAAVKKAAQSIKVPEEASLEKAFEERPSPQTMKELFAAWTDYYFTAGSRSAGRRLLLDNPYHTEVYRIGQRGFCPAYHAVVDPSRVPTLCLAGELDLVTPLSLFKDSPTWPKDGVDYASIPGAGHFPWIENLKDVSAALVKAERRIARSKR